MRAPALVLIVALAGCASTPPTASSQGPKEATASPPESAAAPADTASPEPAPQPEQGQGTPEPEIGPTSAAPAGETKAPEAGQPEAAEAAAASSSASTGPVDAEALVEARSEASPFDTWLAGLRDEALSQGIDAPILDAALADLTPHPRVIALDRRQPEGTLTFQQYLDRVLPRSRIETARRLYDTHREVLESVGRRYGVPPRFVVALWGMETSFGRNTGGFNVIQSLATLAWEGRRSAFFRKELLNALRILDQGDVPPDAMTGSWAGAMGQCQFMPSSYLSWAVDQDGDGRRDIWNTLPDVFGSAANYLKQNGWNDQETWGREVRLPRRFDAALVGLKVEKPLSEWARLGVRRANGRPLPQADMSGSLVQPGGPEGPTYLVYGNYRTLMHWNRSLYFATTVGLLADAIVNR